MEERVVRSVERSRRWRLAAGVAVVATFLAAVAAVQWSSPGSPTVTAAPHGGLWTNGESDDGAMTAGFDPARFGRVGAFGLVTVENVGDDVITLHGVVAEPSEGLSLTEAVVAPPDRVYTWTTFADHFPLDSEVWGDYQPLEGYVIPPSAYDNLPDDFGTQGAGAARSASGRPLRLGHAVMLGFELDENVDVASLDGYCIDYSVGTSSTIYRRCLSQSLRIGDDLSRE